MKPTIADYAARMIPHAATKGTDFLGYIELVDGFGELVDATLKRNGVSSDVEAVSIEELCEREQIAFELGLRLAPYVAGKAAPTPTPQHLAEKLAFEMGGGNITAANVSTELHAIVHSTLGLMEGLYHTVQAMDDSDPDSVGFSSLDILIKRQSKDIARLFGALSAIDDFIKEEDAS